MSLAQTPPGLPLTRRSPRRGSLVGAAGGGLPCQPRSATRCAAAPRAGRAWSTFGPNPIGAERFAAVSNGASFAQVVGTILGKQGQAQIPDKDEAAGSSPARPTNRPLSSGNAGRSASGRRLHRMPPIWDEVLRVLPILSRNNASEQPRCGPIVRRHALDGRLHSGVRTHPCALDHQLDSKIEGDTHWASPSRSSQILVAFSSCGRC